MSSLSPNSLSVFSNEFINSLASGPATNDYASLDDRAAVTLVLHVAAGRHFPRESYPFPDSRFVVSSFLAGTYEETDGETKMEASNGNIDQTLRVKFSGKEFKRLARTYESIEVQALLVDPVCPETRRLVLGSHKIFVLEVPPLSDASKCELQWRDFTGGLSLPRRPQLLCSFSYNASTCLPISSPDLPCISTTKHHYYQFTMKIVSATLLHKAIPVLSTLPTDQAYHLQVLLLGRKFATSSFTDLTVPAFADTPQIFTVRLDHEEATGPPWSELVANNPVVVEFNCADKMLARLEIPLVGFLRQAKIVKTRASRAAYMDNCTAAFSDNLGGEIRYSLTMAMIQETTQEVMNDQTEHHYVNQVKATRTTVSRSSVASILSQC